MLFQDFEKRVFLLIPLEAVLCVAYFEAVQVEFTVDPLISVAVRLSEYVFGPIALVRTPLN